VTAQARVVDRVAAVVGPHVIFLSEVRELATAGIVAAAKEDPLARARAEQKALRDACDALVDMWLVGQEAERYHLSITEADIDKGIASVGANNHMSVPEIMEAAQQAGFTPVRYRSWIRSQLLEYQVILRLHPDKAASIPDEATKLHAELRSRTWVDVRLP
jgi:parvulin-like peptidyl-prolyl isomerase